MSQCFRTVSSKFPPFIGTKKQFTQMNRQLPKHMKCSSFLEEFLGSRNILNTSITLREVTNEIVLPCVSLKNQLMSSLDIPGNAVVSRENAQKRETKFNEFREIQRLHIPEIRSTELEDNWKSRQKFMIRKHKNTKEVVFKRFPVTNKSHIHQIIPSNIKNPGIVLINEKANLQEENKQCEVSGRPKPEQLEFIMENLKKELPNLFIRSIDYSVYSPNIILVNNMRGTTTTGLFQYVKQVAMLRALGHFKFAYVKLEVLKLTMHPEDDSVKVRWRINGLPGFKVFMTFWKFNILKIRESIKDQEVWHDGFSTFYVGGDGKIFKHVVDKMMPDEDKLLPKNKSSVVAKLALFLGLKNLRRIFSNVPTPFFNAGNINQNKKEHPQRIAY